MNVNFSAEDMCIDAQVDIGGETTEIEKANLTIETSYGDGDVEITLTDPYDASKSISIQIANTRVETLCEALLAVAKRMQQGGANSEI